MIFTLTMNPCLDRYIYIDKLVYDDTIRARKIVDYPAGKGIDVSRVIKELGGISIAITFLGGDNGRKIENMLDKEGVIYSSIRVESETRMNIILESKGGQYRISMPGAKISKRKLEVVFEVLEALVREDDIVVISGSLPQGVKPEIYFKIIKLLKDRGSYVYYDTDGEALKIGIHAKPDAIKPNIHEFERLIEKKISSENLSELISEGRRLIAEFELKEILLTLGGKGSLLITNEKALYAHHVEVPIKSAVGAGDSFLAAYVLKKNEGNTEIEAFRWANAAGSAAVMTPGTELCRIEDVLNLLEKIRIEKVKS
ncbi:1-phosphofructokinase family hexose kinase [Thermosipho atlanticus]|uniref:6-phosphofructokinase 2 n=1 Tax=Thermosipho atlanticus DSM 15807 TaxID=1123380 RepID=A0A1M5SMA5_9BACT|nr:1-phosphofructokinase family hexose kinase [Thermosipho atlanticus]SHH39647.1 6-phosphofructokinase 2 [Thermosipho atlanticus DSM 15807]